MNLLGVVLGAVLAGGFALWSGELGARRGRQSWFRQERLAAASDYLRRIDLAIHRFAMGNSVVAGTSAIEKLSASEVVAIMGELLEAQSRVTLLGPDALVEAAQELYGTVLAMSAKAPLAADAPAARQRFVEACRTALKKDPAL
ncbi:MAG: hypothetical protein JWO67_4332 [Streptosporangiaceae bacterium]|nr:hypothetical protein [Streptosporangiaceae bacterium]